MNTPKTTDPAKTSGTSPPHLTLVDGSAPLCEPGEAPCISDACQPISDAALVTQIKVAVREWQTADAEAISAFEVRKAKAETVGKLLAEARMRHPSDEAFGRFLALADVSIKIRRAKDLIKIGLGKKDYAEHCAKAAESQARYMAGLKEAAKVAKEAAKVAREDAHGKAAEPPKKPVSKAKARCMANGTGCSAVRELVRAVAQSKLGKQAAANILADQGHGVKRVTDLKPEYYEAVRQACRDALQVGIEAAEPVYEHVLTDAEIDYRKAHAPVITSDPGEATPEACITDASSEWSDDNGYRTKKSAAALAEFETACEIWLSKMTEADLKKAYHFVASGAWQKAAA